MIEKILDISNEWYERFEPTETFGQRNIAQIGERNFVVIGMRRLGRTELLKYIAKQYSRKEVLFLDLHNPAFNHIDFTDIAGLRREFFESVIKIIKLENIKVLLIDEMQVMTGWSKWLKGMIDHFPDLRYICTGSDALKLKGSKECSREI